MTDKRLVTFTTLASCLSFSETARRLGVSQPAVTKTIAALEAEIGAALFVRYGKTVAMTDRGRALQAIAARVLDGYAEIENIKE